MKKNNIDFFNIIYIITIVLLLTACGAEKYLKQAKQHFELGEYFDAANQYKRAYLITPTKQKKERGQIAAKMAMCYNKANYNTKAITAYRNAIRYKQNNTLLHLDYAKCLMKNANYKEAEKQFLIVLDSLPDNELAQNGLFAAKNAKQWKEQKSQYVVKKNNNINSQRADYSPMLINNNGQYLYFTTTRKEVRGDKISGITGLKCGDIFFSKKNDKGEWTKPKSAEGEINTIYDEGTPAFSPDGRTMYLTQCTTQNNNAKYANIVISKRKDAAWGKTHVLDITSDSLASYAHPAISPDGQWLYFTSDMPGGVGGLDLWRIRITNTGLGGVQNLGEPINTPDDEAFPTFRPNGDLYFSSKGHPGLGGYDIFVAKVNNDGSFVIQHPGYPLNSQADDFGMTFDGMHNRGYFSSNRNDARGMDHIYSFENPEITHSLKGFVYEKDGYELPQAQVYIVGNDGTNQKINVMPDGSFQKLLTTGVEYLLMATCKGYLNHKEEIKITQNKVSTDTIVQFPLASISAPVLIDNIFYDFDKASLREESKTALDKLVILLKENPNITIELRAHTDARGNEKYNLKLSQRRAESVVDYLIKAGIKPQRLKPKGYGKLMPKIIKKKLTETFNRLKEGEVLTPEFIQNIKDEKQREICHQLNRRTEFAVISTTYGLFDDKGQLIKK